MTPDISHVDGVAWYDAPLPRRLHRCRRQTYGYSSWFTFIERCACGSHRMDGEGRWYEKNQTRKARKRTR